MKIIGAGLAGLIAAHKFPQAGILEAAPTRQANHHALLRFRSPAVGEAVGYDFTKVRVHKGIYLNKRFHAPNIRLANLYSMKVAGAVLDRSIWDVEPCDRWVAGEGFIDWLHERVGHRIQYGHLVDVALLSPHEPLISTIPMHQTYKMLGGSVASMPEFRSANISVARFRVQGANVHQTIYFPAEETPVYRASITGDLLIVESIGDHLESHLPNVLAAFALEDADVTPLSKVRQSYGKITPIDEDWRRAFIWEATHKHNVFSLGRFATWRNILLDDVLEDCEVIKRLVTSSTYERAKIYSER